MDGPLAALRRHYALAVLLALAAALRLPWLGAIPNPSGDEGNWTWIAFDLYAHRPAALPPDGRFVSLLFARLIALAFRAAAPSFAAARAVPALGALAGVALTYALLARPATPAARRAAAAAAAVLAVHPWAVAWSRTAAVPYALALALAAAGPLAARAALARPTPLALIAAAQLLALGLHFSPLALVPLAATALWALADPARRAVLRRPAALAALALAALHVVPLLVGAAGVAGRGATRPSHYFNNLGARVLVYGRTVLGGLAGEATLRHFTGITLPWPLEALAIGAVVALVVVAWPPRNARAAGTTPGTAPGTAPGEPADLTRFAALYLVVALVGLPLVLAPARPWNLPAVDAERYLWVVLAPFALLVGALAARPGRGWVAAGFVAYLLLGPTARGVRYFLAGGSPDRGFYTQAGGGGYRGWKVAREREALPVLIRREVDRLAGDGPATIVVADYAFHPLHFVNADGGHPTVDVAKFPLPLRRGELHVFVVWSEGLFAPGYAPATWPDGNRALVARMRSPEFTGLRPVRTFTQANGAPLCELWAAVRR